MVKPIRSNFVFATSCTRDVDLGADSKRCLDFARHDKRNDNGLQGALSRLSSDSRKISTMF